MFQCVITNLLRMWGWNRDQQLPCNVSHPWLWRTTSLRHWRRQFLSKELSPPVSQALRPAWSWSQHPFKIKVWFARSCDSKRYPFLHFSNSSVVSTAYFMLRSSYGFRFIRTRESSNISSTPPHDVFSLLRQEILYLILPVAIPYPLWGTYEPKDPSHFALNILECEVRWVIRAKF